MQPTAKFLLKQRVRVEKCVVIDIKPHYFMVYPTPQPAVRSELDVAYA